MTPQVAPLVSLPIGPCVRFEGAHKLRPVCRTWRRGNSRRRRPPLSSPSRSACPRSAPAARRPDSSQDSSVGSESPDSSAGSESLDRAHRRVHGARQPLAGPTVRRRQWPEVHDLCHTFMHVARNACDFRMAVCFFTRSTCKNVRQNLIPQATA